jgi:hypothetical protein
MKLSKLIGQLQKALDKYGDISVGAYSKDYCGELGEETETSEIYFRVMHDTGSDLPGVSMDEGEAEVEKTACSYYGVIFYQD